MKTRSRQKSSNLETNQSINDLLVENKELKKQINLFIEFKPFFEGICNRLNSYLSKKELDAIQVFNTKFNKVFGEFIKLINNSEEKYSIEVISLRPKTIPNENQLFSDNSKEIKLNINEIHLNDEKSVKCSQLKQSSQKISKLNEESVECKPFVCGFIGCGASYKTKNALKRHKMIHSNSCRFKCDWEGCQYMTNVSDNYRKHWKRHTNRNFICEGFGECSKTYSSKSELKNHIELCHKITERKFKCSFEGCLKAFKNEFQIRRHIYRMHTIREKTVFCDIIGCQFKTYTKNSLDLHKIYSHSDDRPYICTVEGCLKTYKTEVDLKAHEMAIHSSEPLFKCKEPNCGKEFRYTQRLKAHMKRDHLNIKVVIACDWPGCDFTTSTNPSLLRHKVVHSIERNFVCEWPECGKTFKLQRYLDVHLAIHKNDKRYVCGWPGCQYRCCVKSNLTKHERIHKK